MIKCNSAIHTTGRLVLALVTSLASWSAYSQCDYPESTTSANATECSVSVLGGLGAARVAYQEACPGHILRDCDRISGGWQCSSEVIGSSAREPRGDVVATDCTTDQPTPIEPATEDGICQVFGGRSLAATKDQYALACPGIPRQDCDRIEGKWQCSSAEIDDDASGQPAQAPIQPIAGEDEPVAEEPVVENPGTPGNPSTPIPAVNPRPGWADSYSAGGQCYCDSTFDHNIGGKMISTPAGLKSVREICASIGTGPGQSGNPIYNDVQCGNGPANDAGDEDPGVCPGRVDQGPAGCSVIGPRWDLERAFGNSSDPSNGGLLPGSLYRTGDLVSLHYDHCPDRDDGHATVTGRAMVDKFNVDPVVIGGTCGDSNRRQYQSESEAVMDATWGVGNWFNAFTDRTATVQSVGIAWAAVLANGSDVWVAEGGPSDVTGDIVRWIQTNNPQLDTKRIHVVQHSSPGFNESNTSAANLSLIRSSTDYRTIGNGNRPNNGTADLNGSSPSFVAAARSSKFSSAWDAAFTYLNPNKRLDFSDTVELLYIMGDDQVEDFDDFANSYLK